MSIDGFISAIFNTLDFLSAKFNGLNITFYGVQITFAKLVSFVILMKAMKTILWAHDDDITFEDD